MQMQIRFAKIAALIDHNLLRTARDLCADSGIENPEYVRGCAELIIDVTPGLSQDEDKDDLIHFLGAPLIDPNGPLTDDQRKALFAGFRQAFGATPAEDRYTFTRKVLGKKPGHDVSWAHGKPGTITAGEASRLLNVLDAVKDLV